MRHTRGRPGRKEPVVRPCFKCGVNVLTRIKRHKRVRCFYHKKDA